MFPGTALGVLVGDLAYAWLALRLARRTGRTDVTAMPFGLDTPSTIGMALLVLGPAFLKYLRGGPRADSRRPRDLVSGNGGYGHHGAVEAADGIRRARRQALSPAGRNCSVRWPASP